MSFKVKNTHTRPIARGQMQSRWGARRKGTKQSVTLRYGCAVNLFRNDIKLVIQQNYILLFLPPGRCVCSWIHHFMLIFSTTLSILQHILVNFLFIKCPRSIFITRNDSLAVFSAACFFLHSCRLQNNAMAHVASHKEERMATKNSDWIALFYLSRLNVYGSEWAKKRQTLQLNCWTSSMLVYVCREPSECSVHLILFAQININMFN